MKKYNYEKEISKLEQWASSQGLRVKTTPGNNDEVIDMFPDMIEPFFGTFSFNPPPSYRAFLKLYGSLSIQYDENEKNDDDPCWCDLPESIIISSIEKIIDHRGFVLIPEHVSGENEKGDITTNHLIGFSGINSEFQWCFITDKPDADLELPVVSFWADEPLAGRYINTGEYLDPNLKIEYNSFYEWFTDQVNKICKHKKEDLIDDDWFV